MIDLGDDWYGTVTITDSAGAFQDSTITLTIALPDETTVGPFTPTRDSLGHYHYSYSTVQYGKHTAYWAGTNVKFDHSETFNVESSVDISIVSLDDVKTQLNITSTTYDDDLRGYILSVSELVEKTCGICTPRSFSERCEGTWALTVTRLPVLSLTSLTPVYGWTPALSTSQVIINLDTGVITRSNGWEFYGAYTVVTKAGRHVIPPSLRMGTSLIVQYLWMTRRGPQQPGATGGMETVQPPGWPFPIPATAAAMIFANPTSAPGFA